MSSVSRAVLAVVLVFGLCSPALAQAQPSPTGHAFIVSSSWLAEHLSDPNLVLLHVGERSEYDASHIPGAQFIELRDISPPAGALSLELPPVEQLQATFERMGIGDDTHIVAYFGKDWLSPTTRVFFSLDYLGLGGRTALLDGGMPAWRAEGRPLTSEVTTPERKSLTPRVQPLVVDAAWVRSNAGKGGVSVVDARDRVFYTGEREGGTPPLKGHIRGAISIPFGEILTAAEGRFKSFTELAALFREAGVKPGDRVASYCHIGQQATVVYFAARLLGYNAVVYDGSFQDWSARGGRAVTIGEKDR